MSENYKGIFTTKKRDKSYGLYNREGKNIAHMKRNPKGNDEIHIQKNGKILNIRDNQTEYIVELGDE
jgi:hypothetical protein